MGRYKEARPLLEQASQICRALGDRASLAYNSMNLGEICLATGDLRKARQWTEQALQENSSSQDMRGKILALILLANVLLAMGDSPGADKRFNEASELALSLGLADQACESAVGLAACAILQGQLDEARKYVNKAWDYLKEHGWTGMSSPGRVFRACAETFDALGEVENAQAVLESGHQALMEVADKINVPAWRQSFLENVPENRAVMEMWECRKQ